MNKVKFSGKVIEVTKLDSAVIYTLKATDGTIIDAVDVVDCIPFFVVGEYMKVLGSIGNYDSGTPCIKIFEMEGAEEG